MGRCGEAEVERVVHCVKMGASNCKLLFWHANRAARFRVFGHCKRSHVLGMKVMCLVPYRQSVFWG